MASLSGGYATLALVAAMALSCIAAFLWAWGRWPRVARALLAIAVIVAAVTLIRQSARTGQRPFSSAPLAVAAAALALGGWSAVWASASRRRSQVLAAGFVASGLVAYRWLPASLSVGVRGEGWLLAWAEASYALSVGALLWGGLNQPEGRALRVAWVLQTWGLVLQGAGAQWAWGAYWRWDPLECWRLTSWLVLTLAGLGLTVGRPTMFRARLALWGCATWALGVLLGSYALVRWLGMTSFYITL